MTQHDIRSSLAVFDYQNNKLCDLYDSQNDIAGQAFDITRKVSIKDGVKELTFTIPYMVDESKNFRWKFLKSEYIIRLVYNGKTEWYIAQKPEKHKEKNGIYGTVVCAGTEAALRNMNIYKEFDDSNGIGTISYLVDQILAGTGWHRGHTDAMLEEDGVTEKVRSITSGNKKGALGLIGVVCNLFKCYAVYDSDTKTVELYNYNNRDQVLEGTVGHDIEALSVKYNSSDIVTRLYVEGEYGEDGYVGIDSVNPTGLNYIFNFDYFREMGLFKQEHETALSTYLTNIRSVKDSIYSNTANILATEDEISTLIGQCKVVVYYDAQGYATPKFEYGEMTSAQKTLNIGDDVVVLNSNGSFRYEKIVSTPGALILSGDYGIAKFVQKASGSLGAEEVQIEAKQREITNLQRKISTATQAKIQEYEAEIARIQVEISSIYTREDGLYAKMHYVMKSNGLLYELGNYYTINNTLQMQQDDIESDFIIAMGDMLRDGYWNNNNYIAGQEQHLYADAVDYMNVLSKPTVTYNFSLIRLHKDHGIPLENFKLNDIFKLYDPELEINDRLFITEITIGVDREDYGIVEVSNSDITLNVNDLGALLSRMSQLSDLIEQKNTLYSRAQAISRSGTILADRLNGQIDVLKTRLLSTLSNWYTDEQGNIMFESTDGGSAMMLCGAGFMIASSKDDNDEWEWRTFGTGEGFTADEIVAGFISAERIEAGTISVDKVEPGFGGYLVLTGNPSITSLNEQIAPPFEANHAYTSGQYVNHNGVFYLFHTNFSGGTFDQALEYMSATNVATELKLMPDKIVQYVERQGFGKTYVQETDPTLDQQNDVRIGDYWIKASKVQTWGSVSGMTYDALRQDMWGVLKQADAVFYWDGMRWVQIYDFTMMMSAFTRITQTADAIVEEAERADGAYIHRTEEIQTADEIVQRAKDYTDGELEAYSDTTQTASMISTTISNRLGDYYNKNETVSQINTTISSRLGNYYTKEETASQITSTISSQMGNYYTKTETDSRISSTISSELGNYSNTTQTQSMISAAVSNKYEIQTNVDITSDGVDVKAGKYVKITAANNTTAVLIDGNGIDMQTAGKAYIHAKDASNSAIIFGTSLSQANFSVGITGHVYAKSITADNLSINGGTLPNISISETNPGGHGKLWIKPNSATQKQWQFTPASLYLDSYIEGFGYYREYMVTYAAADHLSGEQLYYGIEAKLVAFSVPVAKNITLRAFLVDNNNWYQIGSVTEYAHSDFYNIVLNSMSGLITNIMNVEGGQFRLVLVTDYEPTRCRLDGSVTLKAKSTSASGVSACSVFYIP